MKNYRDATNVAISDGVILLSGEPLEHYTVVREIGRGANGIVFEVHNKLLARREALKVWTQLRTNDSRNKI